MEQYKIQNVLSLFDGMSCGQIALTRCGIKYENYFASEIDKHAIKVTQANYSDTIQLGDVTKWKEWNLPRIDLLIAGSPCQGFSFAGKQLNFDDPRSKLFFEFVDILKFYKPKHFLLENVKMKKEFQHVISDALGVEPVEINSSLVSAQNRKRLFWCNWPVKDNTFLCRIENGVLLARKLTPIECERLQTVPDNYTNHVSNTQRYKMLGNGWTVDVICHIFECLK
jgi:site-specific DNA-cytosine methylase